MASSWQREHLNYLNACEDNATRVFTPFECCRIIPPLYIWDPWPVRLSSGQVAVIDGTELWMGLSASSSLEPGQRHDVARLRLLSLKQDQWRDHGHVFADDASPGSREWAGCATYFPEAGQLEIWYTATGRRGEAKSSYIQRIFCATASLISKDDGFTLCNWSEHWELIKPGGDYRSTLDQLERSAGLIKGFRDPYRFIDPLNGRLYLLFTASLAHANTAFDGAIGAAVGEATDNLKLLPSLLHSDGVNNELERPHVIFHRGLYYLFFSTQASTFHPDVGGPTGLYGFVSNSMAGEWKPLNDSGLVFRNSPDEPCQAYSWLVLQDLRVISFVDFPNLAGLHLNEVEAGGMGRDYFSATISPIENIRIRGNKVQLLTREN